MSESIYIPKYFELYELLPPEMWLQEYYTSEAARERAFANFFDQKLLITIDIIRGDIVKAPLICNTWYQDGNRKYSGLRPADCAIGAPKSQHKLGVNKLCKAADLLCNKYSAEEMRQMVVAKQNLLPYPIRMEKDVPWLHVDTKERSRGPHCKDKVLMFKG